MAKVGNVSKQNVEIKLFCVIFTNLFKSIFCNPENQLQQNKDEMRKSKTFQEWTFFEKWFISNGLSSPKWMQQISNRTTDEWILH